MYLIISTSKSCQQTSSFPMEKIYFPMESIRVYRTTLKFTCLPPPPSLPRPRPCSTSILIILPSSLSLSFVTSCAKQEGEGIKIKKKKKTDHKPFTFESTRPLIIKMQIYSSDLDYIILSTLVRISCPVMTNFYKVIRCNVNGKHSIRFPNKAKSYCSVSR